MDQETANRLFHEYGWLLILDYPAEYDFNIDNQVWITNDKFKGIKLIPPGGHYVHLSEKGNSYGEKFGFFIHFAKAMVVVKKWNSKQGCFESLQESEEIAYAQGVRNYQFDGNLGAYSQKEYKQWVCLSNYISAETIDRLEPIAKSSNLSREIISSTKEQRLRDEELDTDKDANEEEIWTDSKNKAQDDQADDLKENFKYGLDEDIIESLEKELKAEDEKTEQAMQDMYKYKDAYGNVFFTDIPFRKLIHGFSKEQLTRSNFDKSVILKELYDRVYSKIKDGKGQTVDFSQLFLGELQFAFIIFLFGQNYEGFEQWKKMVCLLCHWEEAVYSQKELFTNFIPVIYEQLEQLPNDFFEEVSSGGIYFEPSERKSKFCLKDNFIIESINTFYEICMSEPVEGRKVSKKIKARIAKLKALMMNKFGVDVTTEGERLSGIITRSQDLSGYAQVQDYDGALAEREEIVNRNLATPQDDVMEIENDNTYDNEESQVQNRITKKDFEIVKRQLEIEDDEYLPWIVDLQEKLVSFD